MVLVNDVKIRFRHSSGDLGPYLFASGCKVKDLKERLYQEWPAGVWACILRGGGHRVSPTGAVSSPPACTPQTAALVQRQSLQQKSVSYWGGAFSKRTSQWQVGIPVGMERGVDSVLSTMVVVTYSVHYHRHNRVAQALW